MKDWLPIGRQRIALPPSAEDVSPAGVALNTDNGTIYTVSHSPPTTAGLAAFRIFVTEPSQDGVYPSSSQVLKVDLVALSEQSNSASSPSSQVRSFTYMADGGSAVNDEPALCLITSGGDIVLIPLSSTESPPQPEIVGSVEQGILAAAWSPDEESVVLVVPQDADDVGPSHLHEKMLVMSREFEVLDEKLIREQGKGEEQVSVGWGSKVTQFHGSAGKQAAMAASKPAEADVSAQVAPLADDDWLPHISWRGDCAFFVVSSLEKLDSGAGTRRIVRTFDRSGTLTAVSDDNETGLSHVVAMKPNGNLYATSQRFDPTGAPAVGTFASGRPNRHDIIFFERNGLRRGGFSLRQDEGAAIDGSEGGPTEVPLMDRQTKEREMQSTWSHQHKIIDLRWNCDGSALAVHLQKASNDVLQIWTMGNWHWYLKQEIKSPGASGRIDTWMWHPQEAQQVFVTFQSEEGPGVEAHSFHSCTSAEAQVLPTSSSSVSVTDGAVQRVTFLDKQTIPPPMCSVVVPTTKTATWRSILASDELPDDVDGSLGGWTPRDKAWSHVSIERDGRKVAVSILALLHPFADLVQLWTFTFASPKAPAKATFLGSVDLKAPQDWQPRQVEITSCMVDGKAEILLTVLGDSVASPVLCTGRVAFSLDGARGLTSATNEVVPLPKLLAGKSVLFADQSSEGDGAVFIHHETGEVRLVASRSHPQGLPEPLAIMDEFCPSISAHRSCSEALLVVGLSSSNKLHQLVSMGLGEEVVASTCLARDATSFVISAPFLVWTNSSHEARFLPLSKLCGAQEQDKAAAEVVSLERRLERGSQIVAAAPRQMALILQMPRGNLERIFPRGMVLDRVRNELDQGRYKAALLHCRSNRVDLNLLYDHNPQAFLRDVKQFVEKVNDVDHFNLFLSSLRSEDVTQTMYKPLTSKPVTSGDVSTKVNRICDAFIQELTALGDPKRYINSILTAHVKKSPADYEAALSTLRDMMTTSPELVDSAIEYVIFLAPFDSLFDVALGMYDLTLALMVAQHSKKKDPREYLPFLRELKTVEPVELQRYQIDDHLRRHGKAVKWLAKAGEEHHERALEYMSKYRLFGEGLEVFSQDAKKWKQVQAIYGDYLMERQKWMDASLAFQLAGQVDRALSALHEAGAWQEAFSLVLAERRPAAEIKALASSMASRLQETSRHAEAARVKLEYERNVEGALESYGKANDITECRRICSAVGRLDLIETHVKPAALATQESLLDDVNEMTDQLQKQLARLAELREKKSSAPAAFYGENDTALDNIDIQSDTSTQITQFTRYTKAPSHVGTMSSISATSKGTKKAEKRLKKKEEKKKAAGKKGSIYEEDYLYDSLQKLLLERLGSVQDEVARLLPNLVVLGPAHRQAAITLQDALSAFETKAEEASKSLEDVAYAAGAEADEARVAALTQSSNALANPTNSLLELLAGTTWLDKAAQRKKVEVAQRKWKSEMLDTTMSAGR